MLRSYFKIALRNLWRNKVYTVINIAGLALGIACSLLIFLWVGHEMRYNPFQANGPSLYRVLLTQRYDNGQTSTAPAIPGRLAESLQKRIS